MRRTRFYRSPSTNLQALGFGTEPVDMSPVLIETCAGSRNFDSRVLLSIYKVDVSIATVWNWAARARAKCRAFTPTAPGRVSNCSDRPRAAASGRSTRAPSVIRFSLVSRNTMTKTLAGALAGRCSSNPVRGYRATPASGFHHARPGRSTPTKFHADGEEDEIEHPRDRQSPSRLAIFLSLAGSQE